MLCRCGLRFELFLILVIMLGLVFRLHIHEETDNHSGKIVCAHLNLCDRFSQVLVRQQALFETIVEERPMQLHDLVEGFYTRKPLSQLVKVGF